jgi:YHS domain-containing protein
MRRTVLATILILVVLTAAMSGFAQAKKAEKPEKAKDPVCGLMVDKNPKLSTTYKGETYYFCSRTDLEEFKKAPEKYVKKSGPQG